VSWYECFIEGTDIRETTGKTHETPTEVTTTVNVPKKPPAEPIDFESTVRIHLTGIHSDLRNVRWYYKKKTGMMQESGMY